MNECFIEALETLTEILIEDYENKSVFYITDRDGESYSLSFQKVDVKIK